MNEGKKKVLAMINQQNDPYEFSIGFSGNQRRFKSRVLSVWY